MHIHKTLLIFRTFYELLVTIFIFLIRILIKIKDVRD